MFKTLLLIALLASLARAQQAQWTVMVYMAGDNNLERYVTRDLELELGAVGSSALVRVVALADRAEGYDTARGDWTGTKLFHVVPGMIADAQSAAEDWGERNTGDPQTLADFVHWSRAHFPAERYMLVLWGHGWSWHPGYVMEDERSADSLDADEMRAVIPQLGFIDVVAYDGCNMASIEIGELWHGHASALSHSQEWVGGEGIEYDQVLARLTASPNATADEAAVLLTMSARADATWSAVAVDHRFGQLLADLDAWSIALTADALRNRAAYRRAIRDTQAFWRAPIDRDLRDLALRIGLAANDQSISAHSQRVVEAIDAVVLAERSVPGYSQANGLTIYATASAAHRVDDAYYRSLGFAQRTHWDEFLDTLLGP